LLKGRGNWNGSTENKSTKGNNIDFQTVLDNEIEKIKEERNDEEW
jgi:hypothetical protein